MCRGIRMKGVCDNVKDEKVKDKEVREQNDRIKQSIHKRFEGFLEISHEFR